jgi:hypothetical protein
MKKILFTLSMLVISGTTGYSQITYHDISPDTTISTWDAFAIAPSTNSSNYLIIWWHPSPEVVAQTNGDFQLLFTGTYPAKLLAGDSISASGIWQVANYHALNSGGTGNWQTNANNKFLGFRFKNTTDWLYGWLKMDVGTSGASFTVKEWAYNSVANSSIKAGQVTTTGVSNKYNEENVSITIDSKKVTFKNLGSGHNYPVKILDMNGRIVQKNVIRATEAISLQDLSTGIYIIQLQHDGYLHHFKVELL